MIEIFFKKFQKIFEIWKMYVQIRAQVDGGLRIPGPHPLFAKEIILPNLSKQSLTNKIAWSLVSRLES